MNLSLNYIIKNIVQNMYTFRYINTFYQLSVEPMLS